MRETRVFTRLNRLIPNEGLTQDERMGLLSINSAINWLPAPVVCGEGIILEFNVTRLETCANKTGNDRARLFNRYYSFMRQLNPEYENRALNSEILHLHTFAHLLKKRACFNFGFGSSSIKERIIFQIT